MRLHHPLRLGVTTLAMTAALGAAGAVTASAAGPSATPTPGACSGSVAAQLACIRQRAATAVDNRESALRQMAGDVNSSVAIKAGDKSTLLGQITADTEGSVESVIQSLLPAVQMAINDSSASAAQKAAAQTAFTDCSNHLGAAESASSSIVVEVIDLQPSGYPGNQPTLASARQSAQTARQDLGICYTDLRDIRQDLGF